MVLGIRLILPLAGALAACSASPVPAPAASPSVSPTGRVDGERPTLDRVRIGKAELALVAVDGECTILIDRQVHAIGIPAPCRFLRRNHSAQVTVEDYGGHGRVVMVAGPAAPITDYADGTAETPADACSSIGRPIIEHAGRLALGEIMRSPAGYCPDIGMDEKFYYGIAHAKPFEARQTLR